MRGRAFACDLRSAVVGRPVWFVGAENDADNAFAEVRLGKALRQAGFEHVRFELEPVAAARFYETSLDHDELILIGDFGGGTSDFSLMRVGPGLREGGHTGAQCWGMPASGSPAMRSMPPSSGISSRRRWAPVARCSRWARCCRADRALFQARTLALPVAAAKSICARRARTGSRDGR